MPDIPDIPVMLGGIFPVPVIPDMPPCIDPMPENWATDEYPEFMARGYLDMEFIELGAVG